MDRLTLNESIENSSRITVGKAAHIGRDVGRLIDVMVKVCRNFNDCSSFLAEIENKVISRKRVREEVLEVRRECRK